MNAGQAITAAYDKGRELGRQEAADEIERLRAALRAIVAEDARLNETDAEYDLDDVFLRVVGVAKEALGEDE